MNDNEEQDLFEESAHQSILPYIAAMLIVLGLIFTGVLNVMLYSRAFTDNLKLLAIVPAVLIEGSLAMFIVGGFSWFAKGPQATLAKIFGWAMFGIVAANTLVEFNALVGGKNEQWVSVYAFWGVPVMIPLVVAFWKLVIELDPSIIIMREKNHLRRQMEMAKFKATAQALRTGDFSSAVAYYGQSAAGWARDQVLQQARDRYGDNQLGPRSDDYDSDIDEVVDEVASDVVDPKLPDGDGALTDLKVLRLQTPNPQYTITNENGVVATVKKLNKQFHVFDDKGNEMFVAPTMRKVKETLSSGTPK